MDRCLGFRSRYSNHYRNRKSPRRRHSWEYRFDKRRQQNYSHRRQL